MTDCNYTYKHYIETLLLARAKGYSFITFDELMHGNPKEPYILLRHDVDQRIEPVKAMNELEMINDITSTWFLRVHGRFNILFKRNLDAISELMHVGLHADSYFKKIEYDAEILEAMLGHSILYYSVHDINREVKNNGAKDLICVDFDKLKQYNLKYISDSSHQWREGCMCKWIEKGEPRLYVLIHPMWWFVETSQENY